MPASVITHSHPSASGLSAATKGGSLSNYRGGYKPEHITDIESGAIVAATVRPGNEGDTKDLTDRVPAADSPPKNKVLQSLTADEDYFCIEQT